MSLVTVREHARLTTGAVLAGSLDEASIPVSAFDWLCREAQRHRSGGAPLIQVEDRRWLRLDNYVGVLESPCGTRIEILPKHVQGPCDVDTARRVLIRMLRHALELPARDTGPTSLQVFDAPVSEWIIQQFLHELDGLVRRRLRHDYRLVEEEVRFLRGRLHVSKQLRQPMGRQHLFQVEHHVFDANRPENRLIAAALRKVSPLTRHPANWRLAHELEHQLVDIHPSLDVAGDFRRWSCDRLMAHYRLIRPWCELILGDRNPLSALGEWVGRSLLFPMERVFECFVEASLRRYLPDGATLRTQARSHYLCRQGSMDMFQLRPDFVVECGEMTWVLDAKWKLIDASNDSENYGLRQLDFYQMFAYGHRYLPGKGSLALVFPGCETFSAPLKPFDLEGGLHLDVVPIDLQAGRLIGKLFPKKDSEDRA